MKWTMRRSQKMATLRVAHHLTRDDLVTLLIVCGELDDARSRAFWENAIHQHLAARGSESLWDVRRQLEEDEGADALVLSVEWATSQVDKHWPDSRTPGQTGQQ